MKPINPTASTPKKHIFIDSQSSSIPGFLANLSNLKLAFTKDLTPNF
jgi:hypothetical protein